MNSGENPTKEELEAVCQALTEQIEEAQRLFGQDIDCHELLTSKAALRCIEQLLSSYSNPRNTDDREVA